MVDLFQLLQAVVEAGASDLHLAVANPPVARVNGELKMVQRETNLTDQDMEEILLTLTTRENVATFQREKELDFPYTAPGARPLSSQRVLPAWQHRPFSADTPCRDSDCRRALPPVCLDLSESNEGSGVGDWADGKREIDYPGIFGRPPQ